MLLFCNVVVVVWFRRDSFEAAPVRLDAFDFFLPNIRNPPDLLLSEVGGFAGGEEGDAAAFMGLPPRGLDGVLP